MRYKQVNNTLHLTLESSEALVDSGRMLIRYSVIVVEMWSIWGTRTKYVVSAAPTITSAEESVIKRATEGPLVN